MTRTERQLLGIKKWMRAKCVGILAFYTGVGKTYTAILAIKQILVNTPNLDVRIIVPTSNLKDQWMEYLVTEGLTNNCKIVILNTASKIEDKCDLLIIDEVHLAFSVKFSSVFTKIHHKAFLGLTATAERIDNRHIDFLKYYPIVDTITQEEAVKNNWLSDYKEYLVLLDVDLTDYEAANVEFYSGFEFFNKDFYIALHCATDYQYRIKLAEEMCPFEDEESRAILLKNITVASMRFMRGLKKRKSFIYDHPKKIEVANTIIKNRLDKKIIVFCHTVKLAEQINGDVYSGKDIGQKGKEKLNEFIKKDTGVISSSKKLIVGFDDPKLSVAIDIDTNSSKTRKIQTSGRILRMQEGKVAEVFTLVIKGTVEEDWQRSNIGTSPYITIDEENLMLLLKGEEFNIKKNRETKLSHKY